MNKQSRHLLYFASAFLIVLAGAALASYQLWVEMGVISLVFHGWAAIILGSFGSIILGSGLMWLSFYSSRSGHDEKVGENTDEDDH